MDRTSHSLCDGQVNELVEFHFVAHELFVLTDTVVDDDGCVDGVAQDSEQYSHKVCIDIEAADNEAAVYHAHIVQECYYREHTCGDTAYLSEPEADVDNGDDCGECAGYETLEEEVKTV